MVNTGSPNSMETIAERSGKIADSRPLDRPGRSAEDGLEDLVDRVRVFMLTHRKTPIRHDFQRHTKTLSSAGSTGSL